MQGKPVANQEESKSNQNKGKVAKQKQDFSLSEQQMDQVAGFLTAVEEAFSISEDDSQTASVLESLIVSPARDKALKQTKSWSTNCLIRLYHSHSSLKQEKGVTTLQMFVQQVRESELVQKWMQEAGNAAPETSWRIEDSGYLTHVNMEKTEQPMTD